MKQKGAQTVTFRVELGRFGVFFAAYLAAASVSALWTWRNLDWVMDYVKGSDATVTYGIAFLLTAALPGLWVPFNIVTEICRLFV